MTLVHARALLSIEKISYSFSSLSQNLKVSDEAFRENWYRSYQKPPSTPPPWKRDYYLLYLIKHPHRIITELNRTACSSKVSQYNEWRYWLFWSCTLGQCFVSKWTISGKRSLIFGLCKNDWSRSPPPPPPPILQFCTTPSIQTTFRRHRTNFRPVENSFL